MQRALGSRMSWCSRLCLLFCSNLFFHNALLAVAPVSFREQVAPLLLENCVACHGARNAESGYRVDTYAQLLEAGESGERPIIPNDGEASELLRRLTTSDEYARMPPETDPLSDDQVRIVADWIKSGAEFDGADANESLPFVIPPPRHSDPPAVYHASVPITAVAFSPDGSQILAGGYHEITVWDAAKGTLARRIKNLGQRVFAIRFSPDGNSMAVACGAPGKGGEVRLVDFASGDVKAVLVRSDEVVLDVAFRPGTNQLAVASADQRIRIVDLATFEVTRTLTSHADWVTAIAWSDDGSRLVSASRDNSAKVFDGESGQLLTSYKGHAAAVRGVVMSSDGEHVLSTGSDKELHRWEVGTAKRTAALSLDGEGYKILRGNGFLLLPSADKRLLQIDLATTKVRNEFEGLEDWALSSAWNSESNRVAAGSFGGEICVWNADSGELLQSWVAKP